MTARGIVQALRRPELRRLAPLLSVLAATLLFMGVAFVNGRPTVFYDSDSYDLAGRNFIDVVRHLPESARFHVGGELDVGDSPAQTDQEMDPAMMGARSASYGLLLHTTWRLGTIWLLAGLQCLAAAWVLRLLWRSAAPQAPRWSYLAMAGALTLGTSLSFYATFAMPDVFAGIAGAGAVVMMVYPDRLRRWERIGLWLVLASAMAFHGSHVLLVGAVTLLGAVLVRLSGVDSYATARRTLPLLAGAIAGFAMNAAYAKAFEARTGWELRRPPFLMARLLVDGTGKRYLQHACADATPYVICRYKNQPMADTDSVLWSDKRQNGVFNISDFRTRQQMEREEMRFAIGTALYDPVGQVLASLRNWGEQLVSFRVDDPLRDPKQFLSDDYWGTTSLKDLVPGVRQCQPFGPGCKPPFDRDLLEAWHVGVVLAALGFLAWRGSRRDVIEAVRPRSPEIVGDDRTRRVLVAGALLLVAVIVNAAICGVLSSPWPRYQSRIVWLTPVAAGLLGFGLAPQALFTRTPVWMSTLYERMAAHPLVQKLNWQFLRFCAVGVLGFVVDWAVLEALVHGLGVHPVAGRFVSFSTAVLSTWLANRTWTFKTTNANRLVEAGRYVAVQCTGGLANVSLYSALVWAVPLFHQWLVIPLAAGSAAGLMINYFGNKHLVFRAA